MPTLRRTVTLTAVAAVAAGLTQLAPLPASVGTVALPSAPAPASGEVDRTLGGGLGRLLAQEQPGARSAPGAGGLEVDQESLAIRDDEGRVLVQIAAAEGEDPAALSRQAAEHGFVETADDEATGLVEGFVPLSSVEAVAALPALGTIAQVPRPVTQGGRTTYQGVPFQRVNPVLRRGVDGEGITVGVLSDSYDTATKAASGDPIATRARDDVRSGDLPGRGNPDGNTQPVVVLEDYDRPEASDEGRGMLQIIHDTAPRARLCFATAFSGVVGFADNIRALADPEGACGADVIVDDVGYASETFFSDDVVAAAVDDVAASGVSYFSSAGNAGAENAWRSRVNLVDRSGVRAAARDAGLDFSDVDPALYAGGVQDMNPRGGVDIAQTLQLDPGGGGINLQWSDPRDVDGAETGEPLLDASGRLTRATSADGVDYEVRVPQQLVGQTLYVAADSVPSQSTDLVLSVTTPDGRTVGPIDTDTSPEYASLRIRRSGRYTVTVAGFDGARGRFRVRAAPLLAPSRTTTDFDVLLFDADGNYLGSAGENNRRTGRPIEYVPVSLSDDEYSTVQLVIARVSTGTSPVQEIGYINSYGIVTDEYFTPTAAAIAGHPAARGAVAVAAMGPFRPDLPEVYTSPGGSMRFYFDAQEQPLEPEIRQKPDVMSTTNGNTTFFVADDPRDGDDFPNFGGTSASAPQAAAIAALMLDHAGGPDSLTPAEVAQRMKDTAFRQDLDPFRASGTAGGVTLSARGSQGYEGFAGAGSLNSPNFFRLRYAGAARLRSVTLLGRTASPTARGSRPGSPSAGLVFDPRRPGGPGRWDRGGFPFTVGNVSDGVRRQAVSGHVLDRVGSTPFYERLRVTFATPLRAGQGLGFGIDRDLRYPGGGSPPRGGDSADELGGAVALPADTGGSQGMRFVVTFADGRRAYGRMQNDLGQGFSPVGGWGQVDAYAAVFGED